MSFNPVAIGVGDRWVLRTFGASKFGLFMGEWGDGCHQALPSASRRCEIGSASTLAASFAMSVPG